VPCPGVPFLSMLRRRPRFQCHGAARGASGQPQLSPAAPRTSAPAPPEPAFFHSRLVTFARRVRQFRLHQCSALRRLETLAVPHRPYKAQRRALRLSRMPQFQCSRRRLACPLRRAAQRDQGGLLPREGPAVPADLLRPFLLLCPAIPPAQSLRFRRAPPGDQAGRRRPFGLLALPVPTVRFLPVGRRPPAIPAVPIHLFLRSFLGSGGPLKTCRTFRAGWAGSSLDACLPFGSGWARKPLRANRTLRTSDALRAGRTLRSHWTGRTRRSRFALFTYGSLSARRTLKTSLALCAGNAFRAWRSHWAGRRLGTSRQQKH
jgi:hypothetical protein